MTARVRQVPTWKMTSEELARVYADHHGVTARVGGWLYDSDGRPVCQGWSTLANYLAGYEVTIVGVGVDWAKDRRLGVKRLLGSIRILAANGRERARRTAG